ncbi:MAG: DUF1080 domain-containing protein [Planctomycetaceae bacterium]|nr:DUF1080 domain-containing protein [Planctomycetaceae bacterium]
MMHGHATWLVFIVLSAASAFAEEGNRSPVVSGPPTTATPATGFKSLFNGKNLDGWEGNTKMFRVEDGAIVGGSLQHPIDKNHFLCLTEVYGDFELRLRCKLVGAKANGGVQFRSRRVPNSNEVCGYQADMVDGEYWGCLYDEARRDKTLAGPAREEQNKIVHQGDWNDYVIRCEGRRIQLWVNGHRTVDYLETVPSIPQQGVIGLQIHGGGPSEAWYKDIVITRLPSSQHAKEPSQ